MVVRQCETLASLILKVGKNLTDVVSCILRLDLLLLRRVFIFDNLEKGRVELQALSVEVKFYLDIFSLVH